MRRKLNTGGLAALAMTLVSFDAVYRYPDSTDGFRWLAALMMSIFGGLAWVSFRRFGLWLKHR